MDNNQYINTILKLYVLIYKTSYLLTKLINYIYILNCILVGIINLRFIPMNMNACILVPNVLYIFLIF